jgi:HEAT repeat protein
MHIRRLGAVAAVILAFSATASAQPKKKPGKVDVAAATAKLKGTDADAASKAATVLGTAGPAAHDVLLDALAGGLGPAVAPAAIAAVAVAPAPADVATLKIYARHRNSTVRASALSALSAYPGPVARRLLVGALGDTKPAVRAAAADALARAKARDGVERMFKLLAKGDEGGVKALAAMADPEMARAIGEQLGQVPDSALAKCLGMILRRADFGPDEARVQVVRALAKIQGADAIAELTEYVDKTPAKPPRASRREAEQVIEARIGGGK